MKIITTKSTDGIYYRGILSEAENPKGIIIHIHGMSGTPIQETYYETMHEEYPKAGWSFFTSEHRGTDSIKQFDNEKGETVNLGNAFEIFEDCIHDIQGFINFAKELGYKRIWLQAHSLGPSKTAYYMNQVKSIDVEGLIWISPSDMVGLVHDSIGIKDHEKLLPEAKKLVEENKPRQLLSNYLWDGVMLSAQSYLSFFGENAKDAKKRKANFNKQLVNLASKNKEINVQITVDELTAELINVVENIDFSEQFKVVRDIITKVIIGERSGVKIWAHLPITSTLTEKLGYEPQGWNCRPPKCG